jgi:hypothetical protein
VLRIESLQALGRASEASALGRRFLREHQASVYGPRVRVILQIP